MYYAILYEDHHIMNHSYPLSDHPEDLRAANGRPLVEITLDAAEAGALSAADLQIDAETLHAQAAIAREAGYPQLAANLTRAAELTAVPNDELLRMYELLRPRRATFEELTALADTLVNQYNATATAAFVREAATAYRTRNLLRQPEEVPAA
jgi:propanediol dehydratase small subunit